MSLKLQLASNVITLRKKRGLTMDSLAALTGLSKSSVWEIEHSKGNPTLGTVEALSKGFGVSVSRLLRE